MMATPSKILRKFEKTTADGKVKKFKIVVVSPDMFDQVIEYAFTNFVPESVFLSGVLEDPKKIEQLKNFWYKYVLPQNLSVACFEDGDDKERNKEVVGLNFLLHCTKTDPGPGENSPPPEIDRILNEIGSRFDIFETFGVEEYLGAAGLSVDKKYRGMNIGAEILLARTPLCKEKGIKVTETIFTATGSQVLATKAGFTTLLEIEYSDLEEKLKMKFPLAPKILKVMTKLID